MYIEHELFDRYKGHIISYYHHFTVSEIEAGQLKSLAKMSHSKLQTQLCMFCSMYKLPSKDKEALLKCKRERIIIATVKVS